MTDEALPTEPLRAEHRQLLPHPRALDTAASEIDQWDRDELVHVHGDIVGFLRGHLVPHATAEETGHVPGGRRGHGRSECDRHHAADHAEIMTRIDRLADTAADAVEARGPTATWPVTSPTRSSGAPPCDLPCPRGAGRGERAESGER